MSHVQLYRIIVRYVDREISIFQCKAMQVEKGILLCTSIRGHGAKISVQWQVQ